MNQEQVAQVKHQTSRAIRTHSCQMRRRKRSRSGSAMASDSMKDLKHTKSERPATHLFYHLSLALMLFWLSSQGRAVHCLRISSIEIPPAIWNGSETTLACNYELAPKDQLYSVKWYKDYVEFYRFQPPAATDQTSGPAQAQAPTTTGSAGPDGPGEPTTVGGNLNLNYQISPNSKHEFELEGINLDLSKSNATHVHLRAISLATEAIFKCEISADSPTFATVSAERQMKVYVLPKQKLTLTETSAQQATSVQVPQTGSSSNNQLMHLTVYQLNDLINFTCTSHAARPAARLTWLLNDLPLSTFSLSPPPPPADVLEISQTQSSSIRPQLVETRSNLVLRLQSHHLRQLTARGSNRASQAQYHPPGGGYLPLKLTCLAQMALEFASESSIFISGGGKTSTSKRSKPARDGSGLGNEPLAASWQRDNVATTDLLDQEEHQLVNTHNPRRRLFSGLAATQAGDEDNLDDDTLRRQVISTYRWPPPVPGRAHYGAHQQQQQHAMAWSSVAPPSGAESNYRSSERRTTAQPAPQAAAATGARHIIVWTTRQLRAQSEHIDQLLRRSGANQLELPQIEARTIEASDEPPPDPSAAAGGSSFEVDPYEATPVMSSDPLPPANNYELNELVNFTCYHRGPVEQQQLSVQLKWFLNERELTSDFINAFDGSKFYANSGANLTTTTTTTTRGRLDGRSATVKGVTQRSLVIEFAPSLFQLKELSLKCKSIVEQPVIEFEQSQLLYLATSPFIQAQLPSSSQPPVTINSRPSLYQVTKHRQQQQQPGDQRQRANVIRMRQSGRSSSAAAAGAANNMSSMPLLALTMAVLSSLLLLLALHG